MNLKEYIQENKCNDKCDWKTKCHILDLSGNNIGNEGCKFLKDIKCWSLDLSGNYIGDEGCKYLKKSKQ